jgi:hypothetical protein
MVVDITESRGVGGTIFSANSERGRRWMQEKFGGKIILTYRHADESSDFRREARKAGLVISRIF